MPTPTRKLIIQIPCYNEEQYLPITLGALPESIEGIDTIEVLVINDGSEDETLRVARELGVDHIVDLQPHAGLASAFTAGVAEARRLGADYLVGLDADNQYNADDIQKILEPLVEKRADMVVGERPIEKMKDFSLSKKMLLYTGSWLVRKLSGTGIVDISSGFRGLSRTAMQRLYITDRYTYTIQSLLRAREQNLRIEGTPIRVNREKLRPSRLIKNNFYYVCRSFATVSRYLLDSYLHPLCLALSAVALLPGLYIALRHIFLRYGSGTAGGAQSLQAAALLILVGIVFCIAFFAARSSRNTRRLKYKQEIERRSRAS